MRITSKTNVLLKIIASWDVEPCSFVAVELRSEVRTASIFVLMMEAVRTAEISVYPNESARRYIPEGNHRREDVNLT